MWTAALPSVVLDDVTVAVVLVGTLMKSIRATGCDAVTMWCSSHVLHRTPCSVWCRSHACIREAWIRGFIRSLPERCVGSSTHFTGHFIDVNGEM
jgi:hypothetical protein